MKLDIGYYKVKWRNGPFTTYHYLRVFVKNQKRYIQIDHGQAEEESKNESFNLRGYEVVKKIMRPVAFQKLKLTIQFEDDDGHPFEFGSRNGYTLRRIIHFFPRVAKEFGLDKLPIDKGEMG